MTVSQRAQYQDPEAKAVKWNSAMINFIIHICAFCVTSRMTSMKKGLWLSYMVCLHEAPVRFQAATNATIKVFEEVFVFNRTRFRSHQPLIANLNLYSETNTTTNDIL